MKRRGFSMIELLISMALVAIVGVVGYINLFPRRNQANLSDATAQAVALLREAQSNAMSQKNNVNWGVRFWNTTNVAPSYILFSDTYSTATQVTVQRLPPGISYVPASVAVGAFADVIFTQVSGIASASRTIQFYIPSDPNQSTTITVAASGAIGY